MVLDILGYIGAGVALLSYFGMTLGWWKPIVFDWANATTVFPITASAIQHGAYVGVILPVTFGVIGWLGIYRNYLANIPRAYKGAADDWPYSAGGFM